MNHAESKRFDESRKRIDHACADLRDLLSTHTFRGRQLKLEPPKWVGSLVEALDVYEKDFLKTEGKTPSFPEYEDKLAQQERRLARLASLVRNAINNVIVDLDVLSSYIPKFEGWWLHKFIDKLAKISLGLKNRCETLKHLEKQKGFIQDIVNISHNIYEESPFGYSKEKHYQIILEQDLRKLGYDVGHEQILPMHRMAEQETRVQLGDNTSYRIDIQLRQQRTILELKQTGKISDKELYQIWRYMEEKRHNSPWGLDTQGFLINFGDSDFECWYLFYEKSTGGRKAKCVRKASRRPMSDFVDIVDQGSGISVRRAHI